MKVQKPQRRSRQREIIESELKKLYTHPTAAELYEIVREKLPNVSLGTVYRNLEQLAEMGAIQKLENGSSTRFDGNVDYHNHVRCIHCDKVGDVHEFNEHPLKEQFKQLGGYTIVGFNFEFLGVCPDCQKKHAVVEQ
jgi:Fur family ferric uptake transcriptional regulator